MNDIRQYAGFLHLQYGEEDLKATTHNHVRSWIVSLLKMKNQTVSIRRKLSSLAHFFKWMRRKELISHNPLQKVHLPKIPERLPKALSEGAIHQLWSSFENKSGEDSTYHQLRDQTMIALLYGSGLRRSELIQLKWPDVDTSRRMLRITGKGRKYRQVPISEEVVSLLYKLRKSVDERWGLSEGEGHVILTDSGTIEW
jgi:integrase/recombinase XerC